MRVAWIFAVAGLMSGCAGLQEHPGEAPFSNKPTRSSQEAVAMAKDYAAQGRWQAALGTLDQALSADSESTLLLQTRDRMAARWRHEKQLLNDRIAIVDAENQHAKIALLEELSRAAPNDLLVASRRLYWKGSLRGKATELTECAERYLTAEPALARRCYRIASDIVEDEKLEQRLAAVRAGLQRSDELADQSRRKRKAKTRQRRAKVLLGKAKAAINASDYLGALEILRQVATLQPRNHEMEMLQERAWSMIGPQIESLVKLGDHLYLDEQLEAAIVAWKAALSLKPGDEKIAARIERAKTVLERLESLRERQRPPSTSQPG